MILREVRTFLNNIYEKKIVATVPKLKLYVRMPYYGKHSDKLKFELNNLLNSKYPFLKCNFIFVNQHKIKNFF